MAYPRFLFLLLALIPLVFFSLWRLRSGRGDVKAVAGPWRSSLLVKIFMVKWFFSTLGLIIFLTAVTFALLGLPGENRRVPFHPLGQDVVFVLDVSRSMTAADESPNRLGRGVSIIRGISENIEGGRFGLVVFRGMGMKLFPLSEDREGLSTFLRAVGPDILSAPGTDIASGLKTALEAFPEGSQTDRSLILFTDGEDLKGNPGPILKQIRARKIRLYIVGLGSVKGSRILLADGTPLEDAKGVPVVTRLSLRDLEKMAEFGGGKVFRANQVHLTPLLLRQLNEGLSSGGEGQNEERTERFRLFLVLALLGLFLYQGARIFRWNETY